MKTRMKTGQLPGDVSKRTKAAMLEGKHKDKKRSRAFKKYRMISRERAVLRERTKKEIQDGTH